MVQGHQRVIGEDSKLKGGGERGSKMGERSDWKRDSSGQEEMVANADRSSDPHPV